MGFKRSLLPYNIGDSSVSNIKLVHSGGNSVSLTTPTSNPSSNVTFKLPASDGSAGQVLMTDGNGNLSWVTPGTATTNGITMADQWRLHTSQNGGASASNVDLYQWERVDTAPQGGFIGSAMTLSNSPTTGVFSFPTTGVYLVRASGTFHDAGSNMHYARFSMFATTNNSAYNTIAEGYSSSLTTTQGFQTCYMETLLDVTDTSNIKLKFGFSGLYNVYCMGESTMTIKSLNFSKSFHDDQDYTFLVTVTANDLEEAEKQVPFDSLLYAVNGDTRF